jgi:hypothetical protein
MWAREMPLSAYLVLKRIQTSNEIFDFFFAIEIELRQFNKQSGLLKVGIHIDNITIKDLFFNYK